MRYHGCRCGDWGAERFYNSPKVTWLGRAWYNWGLSEVSDPVFGVLCLPLKWSHCKLWRNALPCLYQSLFINAALADFLVLNGCLWLRFLPPLSFNLFMRSGVWRLPELKGETLSCLQGELADWDVPLTLDVSAGNGFPKSAVPSIINSEMCWRVDQMSSSQLPVSSLKHSREGTNRASEEGADCESEVREGLAVDIGPRSYRMLRLGWV